MGRLEVELTNERDRFRRLALANYYAAYGLSAVAIVTSIVAGLSVASDWFSKSTLAVLSATPGALLVILDRIRFEERSKWHWDRSNGVRSLLQQLLYESKPEAEISAAWRKLIDDLNTKWPGLQKAVTGVDTPRQP